MSWEGALTNPDDVYPGFVRGEMANIVKRTLKAGATVPLTFIGVGMTAVVFESRGRAWKTARHADSSTNREWIEDEAEYLAAVTKVPAIARHFPRLYRYHPHEVVIEREIIMGPSKSLYRGGSGYVDTNALAEKIEKAMSALGWGHPEPKEDSVRLRENGTPVFVNAGMAPRFGRNLLDYAHEVARGKRARPKSISDLAWAIRADVMGISRFPVQTSKSEAKAAIEALAKLDPRARKHARDLSD